MFERFTERARRVIVLAQQEARMLNHGHIGTEHLLLGLIREGEGVAPKALESLGISLEAVRKEVEEIIGQGETVPVGHIPFTPRSKKVLELSLREAIELGHNYIGTEHILLGLVREREGVAAQVLVKLGARLEDVRQQVIQLLSGYTRRLVEDLVLTEEEQGASVDPSPGLEGLMRGRLAAAINSMSGREKMVLTLHHFEGLTLAEIGDVLGLPESRVRAIHTKAANKLRDMLAERSGSVGDEPRAPSDEVPRCPRCRRELGETGAVVTLELPVEGTDETRAVNFAFCRRCGTCLGTV